MLVKPPSSSSSSSSTTSPRKRGAFIVLEGVDRCGKTTQVGLLVKHLIKTLGMAAAVAMRFPDRTTLIGQMIDQYLRDKTHHVEDHAIHLLFSANRWEASTTLTNHLLQGTTVVCDRYAYSGVAFSSAKEQSQQRPEKAGVVGVEVTTNEHGGSTSAPKNNSRMMPVMSMEWCQSPDIGLPAPDCVIFLDLSQEEAELRGGYVQYEFIATCLWDWMIFWNSASPNEK
jgi:dTMP kinase